MWPILAAILLVVVVAVHFFWKRKYLSAVQSNVGQLEQAREQHRDIFASSEAQQRALLDSMIEGLLLLDNEGRIRLANRALEKLIGINADHYGKTIIEAFRNHELAALVTRLKKERQIVGFELQLAEIQSRWFQINAAAITDHDNDPAGSILVFHDLTQLRQLENTRQEFVANVSHELRTPLSMIKGYVETLLDGAKDDPAVAEKFLGIIEKHTDRLTFLIEDLLTISKLESGRVILNCQPLKLHPLVAKVIQDLQSRAAEKGMKLENRISNDLEVFADADRLEQVFWNLIDNAIKYSRIDGSVIIDGRFSDDGKIEISVEDDGPGIPPEARERIFERFFRLDKARSREQGGTGLGLAIVKHVIQCHGGKVWVESEPDQGACFHFTLEAPPAPSSFSK